MQSFPRALCAAAFLFAAGAASAEDVPIHEAAGFTLTRSDNDPLVEVGVVSETAGSVTFSLWGLDSRFSLSTDSSYKPWSADSTWFQTSYGIDVKQGYKITGITVTGTFAGELRPAQWTMPGDANNEMLFSMFIGAGGDTSSVVDLDGTQAFALDSGAMARQDDFSVGFYGASSVGAESVFYYDEITGEEYWLGSQASASITGLTMTVNVSPVPEPGTWAMLTLGLAAVAAATRLRRRGNAQ